jgi:hypothetical protein
MRDQQKNKTGPAGQKTLVRGGKSGAGDAASRQLRGASSKLGNAALDERLAKAAPQAAVAPKVEPAVAKQAPVVVEKVAEAKAAPAKVVEKAPQVVEKVAEAKVAAPQAPAVAEAKAAPAQVIEKTPEVKAPEAKAAAVQVPEAKAAAVKAPEAKVAEAKVAEVKVPETKVAETKVAAKAPAKDAVKAPVVVEKAPEAKVAAAKAPEAKTAAEKVTAAAPAKVAEKAPSTVVDKAPESAKKAAEAKAPAVVVAEKAPVVVKVAEEEKAAPKKGTEEKKDAQATDLDPKANAQQKALLDHICGRVKAIYTVQQVERAEMKNENQWFRDVARGREGYHLPDPTRFHEATQLYQRAAKALCAGDVAQGAKLMEKAMTAEREALDNLPKMVENKLTTAERTAPEAPAALAGATTEVTPAERIAMPKEMELARKILSIEDKMEPTAPLKHNKKRWFSDLEEDEDENNPNKKTGEAKGA